MAPPKPAAVSAAAASSPPPDRNANPPLSSTEQHSRRRHSNNPARRPLVRADTADSTREYMRSYGTMAIAPPSPASAAAAPAAAAAPPAQPAPPRPRSSTQSTVATVASTAPTPNRASGSRQPLLVRRTFSHELDEPVYSCTTNPHTHLPVYTNIHRIRRDIVSVVEDYVSPEQLHDMRINISVVRPLVDTLYALDDISIVYCLLVNRARFLAEQAHLSNRQNVNFSRAALCELIAHRVLRRYNEDNEGLEGLLVLANILVAGFEPFQNAPAAVRPEGYDPYEDLDGDGQGDGDDSHPRARRPANVNPKWFYRKTLPALEVAILTESKFFLSSTACQKVIEAIYVGRVTYTPSSLLDIIPDRYKQKPIALYDPRSASLLNQYRLIVPRTRNILEFVQFAVLLVLYLLFMAERDATRVRPLEVAFSVYSFGWVLDQFATILEHGWHVYTQNLWSFLDVTYGAVYWVYLVLRVHGVRTGSVATGQQALDVLALAAPVLIPRIAFTALSGNMLFVSMRSMMADFLLLSFLATWCFAGFLLSLAWLGEGRIPLALIGKWMVYIWFGLDATGIHRAGEFHWLLGPGLMVAFAFLGNTLFLTILVSMLSNTFSTIVKNATAEVQYRRAVLTLEGVKSDAIFAYQPPFNIVALFVLVPLKFCVSPRWFHKIHVACVRSINLPVLLLIAAAERRLLWPASPYSKHYTAYRRSSAASDPFYGPDGRGGSAGGSGQDTRAATGSGGGGGGGAARIRAAYDRARARARSSMFGTWWRITAHSDLQAVFEVPPPDEIENEIAADDDLTAHLLRRQFVRQARAAAKADGPAQEAGSGGDGGGGGGSGGGNSNGSATGPASPPPHTAKSPLRRSGSVVKFAEPPQADLRRRDSIAFPGLDPDKLRRLLELEEAATRMPGGADGAQQDGTADGTQGTVDSAQVAGRLDALEGAMQRIEGLLTQLLQQQQPQGTVAVTGDDALAAAREAEQAVVDDEELELAEQTGTMADLDQTADEQ